MDKQIKINGTTYAVIRTREFEHNGAKRETLFLRRANGTRVYTATRYENGAMSSVVPWPVSADKGRQGPPETVWRECSPGSKGLNPGSFDEDMDGAYMRGFKAAKRQAAGDYDRGVVAGLRLALAICSGREDMLAERLASEIQDAIDSSRYTSDA